MKTFATLLLHYLRGRASRRNLAVLARMLLLLAGLIAVYSTIFHYLMLWEDPPQRYSWITGVYWTLTVMSTLGFGDITFHTDVGRIFSIVVLAQWDGVYAHPAALHLHPILLRPVDGSAGRRAGAAASCLQQTERPRGPHPATVRSTRR